MAALTSAYWISFARTGDPNGEGRVQWSRHDPSADRVMNFTNDGVIVGPDRIKAHLDVWRSIWE